MWKNRGHKLTGEAEGILGGVGRILLWVEGWRELVTRQVCQYCLDINGNMHNKTTPSPLVTPLIVSLMCARC